MRTQAGCTRSLYTGVSLFVFQSPMASPSGATASHVLLAQPVILCRKIPCQDGTDFRGWGLNIGAPVGGVLHRGGVP